jgi:hypothetical protein
MEVTMPVKTKEKRDNLVAVEETDFIIILGKKWC